MDDQTDNPLDKLFVDKQPLALDILAETIQPYVQLLREPPKVLFTLEWQDLPNRKRILCYLLGRKALQEAFKDDPNVSYDERATASTVESETEIPGGSVRPALSQLRDKRLVRNVDGYFVPNSALIQVCNYITSDEG